MDYRIRLKQLREDHDLSQEQVAKIIGRSKRSYNDIENGASKLRISELILLCEYYDVSADYLIGMTDDPENGESSA